MKHQERQKQVYLKGAMGVRPGIPFDFESLEMAAEKRLTPEAFGYIAGGAGSEMTMRQNRADFERIQIVPRMLRNVEMRSTATDFFGYAIPSPIFIPPIGVLEMAHPEADIAVAKAAASLHIPFVFSNQASVPMEQTAAVMADSPRFFQLYWSKSDELVASLLQRAEASGCSAIVVTLDTTMLGWRMRDLNLASLPFLKGMGIAQYTSDPHFLKLMEQPEEMPAASAFSFEGLRTLIAANQRFPGSFIDNLKRGNGLKAVRKFIEIYSRPNITWTDLPLLRRFTSLPIILKGILHPDDAKKALDYGIDGIYISNHGGRQVDGSVSTIGMLPAIADAINGRVPILIDSGFRSGADVFKAIALGATAIGIGRGYTYALALGGQSGMEQHLQNWMAEFDLQMGLCGCKNVSEITREMVLFR